MRSEEEIENRIKSLKEDAEKYKDGLDFSAYAIVICKIDALSWVLERK